MILSSIAAPQLEQIILSGDHTTLKKVKGIGAKTAERIIVDLKDKIKPIGDSFILEQTMSNEVFDEALAALVMLGFNRLQSQKVLKKLFENEPSIKVEMAIKKALSMM